MTRLAAWLRLMLGAIALAGLIALAAPALAQQQGQLIDPQVSVVNEQILLRELPRIQGDIDQLDPRARVLIQPAGRVWRQAVLETADAAIEWREPAGGIENELGRHLQ